MPVKQGNCRGCHLPHYGEEKRLLANRDPFLCLQCHAADKPTNIKAHQGLLQNTSLCLECHEPHIAAKGSLLKKNEHSPFAKRDCKLCHK
jgi:predicted CXXCH cytochrome family protein